MSNPFPAFTLTLAVYAHVRSRKAKVENYPPCAEELGSPSQLCRGEAGDFAASMALSDTWVAGLSPGHGGHASNSPHYVGP